MSRHALRYLVFLAAATVLLPVQSSAQPSTSLEEDYAKLCANRPEPASETCVALKNALIAKLSGNSGSNAPAPTVVPAAQPAPRDPAEQAKREANRLRFGVYADMVGKSYFGTNGGNYPYVAEVSWEWPDEAIVVTMYGATATGEIQESAECPPTKWFFRFKASTNQVTRTIAKPCWPQQPAAEVRIQADGAVFQTEIKGKYRDYMARKADGNYKWVRQERKGDTWVPVKYAWSTLYERTPQFLASLREEQQRLAASRRSEEGDSGLAGALAMGLGAALAGGNAEQVMGMAMKGAELTTDNEMSRNVLAGQGDAMVAAGTQRMAAENQSVAGSSGSVSAAGADTRAGVAMPAGSPATAPAAKSATVSTTAYLIVGMRPTEKNTRNPMCYSTPFQISYQSEENHWGDSGRAEAAAMAYRGQFEAACSRHGQVDGITSPHIQSINGGSASASATNEDFVVPIP
jgi:hypothetical protein